MVEIVSLVKFYILLGELWCNNIRNQELLLYILPDVNVARIAVHLQPNDRFCSCVLYWLYKLYCSGRLEKVHKAMSVDAHFAQKWRYSDTVWWIMCYAVKWEIAVHHFVKNCLTHSALWLQILSGLKKKISATVQVSLYTQLHVTKSEAQFRSLSTHSFM